MESIALIYNRLKMSTKNNDWNGNENGKGNAKVKEVIHRIEEGDSVGNIIKNPLFKSFSSDESQYLLDYLSKLYHFDTPLISDDYYDTLESIHGEKFGKNKKIGARPDNEEHEEKEDDGERESERRQEKVQGQVQGQGNRIKDGEVVCRPSGHKPKIVDLPTPMWGLSKLKDDKGLNNYSRKFREANFVLTDKLDGNAANFVYNVDKKGKISLGLYKRGDEKKGTDLTYLLPYIKNIPDSIPPEYTALSVKGELVIDRDTFLRKYRDAACARNTVSGLTNSKEFYKEEASDIKFVPYYIYYLKNREGSELLIDGQSGQLELLQAIGFEIPYYSVIHLEDLNSENLSLILSKRKEKSRYDIDGICICADIPIEIPLDKDPEHIVAFKMLGDTGLTRVTNIVWSVGKRGTYDPIVHFETVLLDGAKLNKASGYNARFIVKNGIGKGAKIVVTRSGGVIPKIIETISSVEPELPEEGTFEWIISKEGEEPIFIRPLNNIGDEQIEIRKIVAFFKERESEFLALKTISKLYFGGYNTLKSLFNIKVEDICKIDGFKKKSAERIYFNINKAIFDAPLHEVMAGSSLFPGFGKKRLKQIIIGLGEEYILSLWHIPVEDRKDENRKLRDRLKRLGGFNKLTSIFVDNIYPFLEWLDEHPEIQLSSSILPVVFEGDEEDEDGGSDEKKECKRLRGEVISFSNCRPDVHIERGIERLGGTVSVNLVKSTTILVVKNADPDKLTVKMKTALDRGVRIISMEEFKKEYGV